MMEGSRDAVITLVGYSIDTVEASVVVIRWLGRRDRKGYDDGWVVWCGKVRVPAKYQIQQ